MKYLGRYLKRPPVSASRLRHYGSGAVVHHYLNHRTGKHKGQMLSERSTPVVWRERRCCAASGVCMTGAPLYTLLHAYPPSR